MLAQRPYLFEAIYRWILDNHWTPYLLVDARKSEVLVPDYLVENGQIVLNISPHAIAHYFKDERAISFSARFSGKSMEIFVPFEAMAALYAKENNLGLMFPPEFLHEQKKPEDKTMESEVEQNKNKKDGSKNKHGLKVIK